jgi:hypothetical protein
MKRGFTLASCGVVALLISGAAQAMALQYVGGDPYRTPAPIGSTLGNQIIPLVNGRVGGNLAFDGPAEITWTFLGKEAGFTNRLTSGGCSILNTSRVGTSCTSLHAGGELSWAFLVLNTLRWVTPSTNFNPATRGGSDPTVFLAIRNPFEFYISLDDGGGGPDDNHDDHVLHGFLRPSVGVPEPGTVGLMAMVVLLGASAYRLRRRA